MPDSIDFARFKLGLVATVFAASVTGAEFPAKGSKPPNVLIVTADNLGYGDLRCYNPKSTIKTPNLDRLAKQGARLTGFYTASPTCSVSRACLLTGRIAQRHGLTRQLPGVKGNYGVGLNPKEILIPQILKTAPTPYAAGCFGKWNIGFAKGSRPTERGFEEFIGHASGNLDYYNHNYREKHDLYQGTEPVAVSRSRYSAASCNRVGNRLPRNSVGQCCSWDRIWRFFSIFRPLLKRIGD